MNVISFHEIDDDAGRQVSAVICYLGQFEAFLENVTCYACACEVLQAMAVMHATLKETGGSAKLNSEWLSQSLLLS